MMSLHFSPGELPRCFANPSGHIPMDGLMCGDFPKCLHPCSRSSVPKGQPYQQCHTLAPRSWGAQQWQGTVLPWMEVGESQLARCWHVDSFRLSPAPRCQACPPTLAVQMDTGCPSAWHPGMVMSLPSWSSLQLLAFLPAGFSVPPCPSSFTVCKPCSSVG